MLFAFSIASSGVRKVSTESTGPKISSWAIRWDWLTPVNSVGRKKKPLSGRTQSGWKISAPSSIPDWTSSCDLGQLAGRVDGADVGVLVERVADAQGREAVLQLVEQRLVDRFLGEQPRPGAAHLALVEVDAVDDPLDRLVERRVVEDDVGGLAAKLQGELLVRARDGRAAIILPTAVEPVKATLLTSGCVTSSIPISPGPVMMFTTPGGSSAWRTTSANR